MRHSGVQPERGFPACAIAAVVIIAAGWIQRMASDEGDAALQCIGSAVVEVLLGAYFEAHQTSSAAASSPTVANRWMATSRAVVGPTDSVKIINLPQPSSRLLKNAMR